MATTEPHAVGTGEERAWALFFDALDASNDAARRLPPGAAIVAADAPDRGELVRRYHADRRAVVIVHADGREEIRKPPRPERIALLLAVVVGAWLLLREPHQSRV
jgi:hypothetical protein